MRYPFETQTGSKLKSEHTYALVRTRRSPRYTMPLFYSGHAPIEDYEEWMNFHTLIAKNGGRRRDIGAEAGAAADVGERSGRDTGAELVLSAPIPSAAVASGQSFEERENGWVTQLLLPSEGLKGGISLSSIANLTHLTHLNLSHNSLLGSLETKLFLSLNRLEILDLSYNLLSGELPLSLPSDNIWIVYLSSNHFRGAIPPSLFQQASNLTSFNINNNTFTGTRGVFQTAELRSNHLEGDISMLDFSRLSELAKLDLRFNNFTGTIPVSLYSCRGNEDIDELQKSLYTHAWWFLYSAIRSNRTFEYLKYPVMIDLPRNKIVGDIPIDIGHLALLRSLRLSSNNFSGTILDQIPNLKFLEVLDLSTNQLSGQIPLSFASLNFLKDLNVSYNNLQGPIPTSTQLQSCNESAFEGNPKLCGAPLPNKCERNKGIDANNKNNNDVVDNGLHQLPWFHIFAALGFIVGFWGVCGSLVINKTWRFVYFRFLENLQNRLYVMITVCINMMRRTLRG
ncbi:unnamed protein product [Prunus armeniaca]